MPKTDLRYQPSVAGILRNERGEILVCERLDTLGAWQFPQGSLAAGETPRQALRREIQEEIGLRKSAYLVVEERGPYRYLYGGGRKKKGFHGKKQQYFLLQAVAVEPPIDLATAHPEFQAYRWIQPPHFRLGWLPPSKREVYTQVFHDFFGLKLG